MRLPRPTPEPGRPPAPEPPEDQTFLHARFRVAQFLRDSPVGPDGISAPLVVHMVVKETPVLNDALVSWAIYKFLMEQRLRPVRETPAYDPRDSWGAYYSFGPPGVPAAAIREIVSFVEQVVAPTGELAGCPRFVGKSI